MKSKLARFAGSQVAQQVIRQHTGVGNVLDMRFGAHLLRNRNIPVGSKLLALALGIGLTCGLIAMEVPLEGLLAVFLPVGGVVLDSIIDGAEVILGPLVFAALMLPHLAPRPLVEQVRGEQAMALPTR